MNVSSVGFTQQTYSFQARAAQGVQAPGNGNSFAGAGFAAEMSMANQDLADAWTGFGDVLPHFGHQPRF